MNTSFKNRYALVPGASNAAAFKSRVPGYFLSRDESWKYSVLIQVK